LDYIRKFIKNDRTKMIKVLIHNDHKEKRESFEARLDESCSQIFTEAYDASESDVIEKLKENILLKIEELKNIDFSSPIYVDCLGQPIDKPLKF